MGSTDDAILTFFSEVDGFFAENTFALAVFRVKLIEVWLMKKVACNQNHFYNDAISQKKFMP